ncbi:helicase SRCAP [Chanos chanos]|uniref:Helicase SRCAP n=1 Tax=Chanos chanos TaxID=29144 RepID=A0A6J2VGG7_CHACN|nr:helicase SRCAP [Chanos chanos]
MTLGGQSELDQQLSPVHRISAAKGAQHGAEERHEAPGAESSDGEADMSMEAQNDNSIVTPNPTQNKVRQWIAGRTTASSSPSTSPAPSPSPAPLSSGDWAQSQTDRASPVCGPHGKNMPPSSQGGSGGQSEQTPTQRSRSEKHTDMAELAKHEAEIEHRTLALKREGFWSLKRLSRVTEPVRPKVHWDYLCEEMQWLSADFAQERRWKRGVARKVVRMVMRYHEELRQKEERAKREEQAKLRRVASSIAKEVRAFWSNVEKVVQYKQQSRLEEKRKKALDLQLDFIVGQTERYSDLLSQSLQAAPVTNTEAPTPPPKHSQLNVVDEDDRDFVPQCDEEDDEETIEVEEQQEGNDAETQRREIELLRQEGMLPLDQLLSTLALPQESASEEELSDESSSVVEDEDEEFTANEDDAEDEEETIEAQEMIEGDGDHAEELDDLAKEGEMSMAELLEKYKGAYASDFEEPSASASSASSEESEGTEEEEEEETEGDDSEDDSGTSSDSAAGEDSDDEVEEDEDEEEGNSDDKEDDDDDEEEEDDDGGEGMEILLREGDHSPPLATSPRPKKEISHIAATAESLQPKGYTLATTKVKTPIPFLLHGTLREYQHIGLDWLVTMYEKKLNGILADEMGLGKTIQTIALLAHLACEKGNWGPHLIIVPTSVMLNWEMELKRWCPGFKILTYYGSQKERKLKRQGWTKPNAFHVCITSYKLVLQDHQAFRRKSWRYLILDEAQNIKNFKSQRWQSLLNFNSQRRLLLTGTPLQNSLMELWSLMHFLMPHVFQSHREFKEWFSNPLTGMIEGSQEYNEGLVKRLHKVLRPFLLRRIKADVEKQMPKKYEHVIRCRLSKRQRFLYDDFMAQASTRETLASGHFMSVINILMQLRKVCNHPNLFDPRPIQSPFITEPIVYSTASLVQQALETSPFKCCDLSMFDLIGLEGRVSRYQADVFVPRRKVTHQLIQEIMDSPQPPPRPKPVRMKVNRMLQPLPKADGRTVVVVNNPRPTCPVPPAAQPPRLPLITEINPAPSSALPAPQVCTVGPTAAPRAPVCPNPPAVAVGTGVAVRPGVAHPVMTVRPPTAAGTPTVSAAPPPTSNVTTQRVLLSPDMQARLPSGEVVSIAQLASLAGRPVSSCQGSKPVTFQLQGNKLTLSGTQLHQVPVQQPRPIQGNVMHLVSSSGQHHLISQPAQVALFQAVSQSGTGSINTHPVSSAPGPSGLAVPLCTAQVSSTVVNSPGIVKIVVRQSAGKEGGVVPTLAVPPSPRAAPPQAVSLHPHGTPGPVLRLPAPPQQPPHRPPVYAAPPRIPTSASVQPQPPRPVLRVVQGPAANTEQARVNAPSGREDSSDVIAVRMSTPKAASASQGGGFAFQRPRFQPPPPPRSPFYMASLAESQKAQRDDRLSHIIRVNEQHCNTRPVYGCEVLDFLTFLPGSRPAPARPVLGDWGHSGYASCLTAQSRNKDDYWNQSEALKAAIHSSEERLQLLSEIIDRFTFVIPPVEAKPITIHSCHPPPSLSHQQAVFSSMLSSKVTPLTHCLHRIQCNTRTQFPDLRLIQYDCGKLQTLHILLRRLRAEGHRVLIFTQMTRMLDILEQFLNYHGHIYLRLDGSTRVEQRQALMERFNADRRIFCFILSTRSGGVGVNLTGADTVVFYDSDWNPTMDAQAQDRCHRIGQTRDVHIYRLISERTVEENILKKANQKRMLGDMAIEGGNFTTAFFKQQTIRELFDVSEGEKKEAEVNMPSSEEEEAINKQKTTILEQALCRAEDEEDIVAASQAKAEQVAELAEFNESIPLDDGGEGIGRDQEEEELSKAEQEIAALVEQLTPIERYAMNFLEASLEDICKEELKQAEEQVEAARKGLDQAKEEGLKLHQSSDSDEDDLLHLTAEEPTQPTPARRTRKHKEKGAPSTRVSGRLRGTPARTDDDTSPVRPSPEQERGRRLGSQNSEPNASRATPAASSTLKSPPPRETPDRLRSGLRGKGTTKEPTASAAPSRTEQNQTSPRVSDSSRPSSPPKDFGGKSHQPNSPSGSELSAATSRAAERAHGGHAASPATSVIAHRDSGEELKKEAKSDTPQQVRRERRGSMSSDSICSPEHQPDHDGREQEQDLQHSQPLSPTLSSALSRSPRKRQSADGEVLRGLPEDSPSAKVLRKLPGRLVTVVEEKEPRRRRRGGSGSGGVHTEGSSEETEHPDCAPDVAPVSPDRSQTSKEKGVSSKSSPPSSNVPQTQQVQDQASPTLPSSPGRGYHPCSPTHSPDMPVLRNLPVRRRLETESRMAAQLGEQYLGRGRGVDRRRSLSPNFPNKQDPGAAKDGSSLSPPAPADVNVTTAPVKRKRGRPPKTPPRAPEPPVQQQASPPRTSASEEQSPPLSPKRRRGRPRKESATTPAGTVRDGQQPKQSTTSSLSSLQQAGPTSPRSNPPSSSAGPETRSLVPEPRSERLTATDPIQTPTAAPVKAADSTQLPVADSQTNLTTTPSAPSCPKPSHSEVQSTLLTVTQPLSSDVQSNLNPTLPSQLASPTDPQINATITAAPQTTSTPNAIQTNVTSTLALQLPANLSEHITNVNPMPASTPTLRSPPAVSQTNPATSSFSQVVTISSTATTASPQITPTCDQTSLNPQIPQSSTELTQNPESTQPSLNPSTTTTASKLPSPSQTSTQPSVPTTGSAEASPTPIQKSTEPSVTPSPTTIASPQSSKATVSLQSLPTHNKTTVFTSKHPPASSPATSVPRQSSPALDDAVTQAKNPEGQTNSEVKIEVETTQEKMEVEESEKDGRTVEEGEGDGSESRPKRRKVENVPVTETDARVSSGGDGGTVSAGDGARERDESENRTSAKKRPISRQSSQESARSSSPSSVSSSGTRSSLSKKTGKSRMPAKRKRVEDTTEGDAVEGTTEGDAVEGTTEGDATGDAGDEPAARSQRGRSRSSSSSSSSGDSEERNEKRLTRSAQRILEKEAKNVKGDNVIKQRRSSGKKSSTETSVRVTRKSSGPQSVSQSSTSTPVTPALSPEPEVLGKRCSALNAAAKLLAMRGRGPDTPSPGPRGKASAGVQHAGSPLSSEKNARPKSRGSQDSPLTNSCNSKGGSSGRQTPTQPPHQTSDSSHTAARSTRQRPGSLLPPLKTDNKRAKREDKRKTSEQREEGEDENREAARSPRGHSACSSVSSDRGAGSSRSRSSSNSSQRTHSLSSQSTGPPRSRSRAPSSGSETERGKRKRGEGRGRESRRERRSQKKDRPELSAGSSEGTPDRVLRSVAALAAAQARTPASNTRSSSTQQRHSKT